MSDSGKGQWGGKRPGAGRPRNEVIPEVMAQARVSRSALYRHLREKERLTPEAMEFAKNHSDTRLITHKALEIAGEFDTPEGQIATLKLAIEQRKARKQMSIARALVNWQRLLQSGGV
jgi:AcrR family transcriptional regulator